MLEIPELNRTE